MTPLARYTDRKGVFFMTAASSSLRRVAVSALFLSIALVLKTFFSLYIPLFGQNGISVGLSGVFSMMPSLLFGPFYGAAVSGLSDLLGYVLRPTGAFMPLLTLTAALGGFLRGLCYRALKGKRDKGMRLAVILFSVALLAVGLVDLAMLRADNIDASYYQRVPPQQAEAESQTLSPVGRMLIARTVNTKDPSGNLASYLTSLTAGPLGCAALGFMLLLADLAARRLLPRQGRAGVLAMLLTVVGTGLLITTLNTIILRETIYASWKLLPFAVVWIPRVIEEILVGAVKVCFMAVLTEVFYARPAFKQWVT